MEYLGINLAIMHRTNAENHRRLIQKIKEGLWCTTFMDWEAQNVKDVWFLQFLSKSQQDFYRYRKDNLKFTWKSKSSYNHKTVLKKKNKVSRIILSNFETYYTAIVIKSTGQTQNRIENLKIDRREMWVFVKVQSEDSFKWWKCSVSLLQYCIVALKMLSLGETGWRYMDFSVLFLTTACESTSISKPKV
jgi:hypothetical protein